MTKTTGNNNNSNFNGTTKNKKLKLSLMRTSSFIIRIPNCIVGCLVTLELLFLITNLDVFLRWIYELRLLFAGAGITFAGLYIFWPAQVNYRRIYKFLKRNIFYILEFVFIVIILYHLDEFRSWLGSGPAYAIIGWLFIAALITLSHLYTLRYEAARRARRQKFQNNK